MYMEALLSALGNINQGIGLYQGYLHRKQEERQTAEAERQTAEERKQTAYQLQRQKIEMERKDNEYKFQQHQRAKSDANDLMTALSYNYANNLKKEAIARKTGRPVDFENDDPQLVTKFVLFKKNYGKHVQEYFGDNQYSVLLDNAMNRGINQYNQDFGRFLGVQARPKANIFDNINDGAIGYSLQQVADEAVHKKLLHEEFKQLRQSIISNPYSFSDEQINNARKEVINNG